MAKIDAILRTLKNDIILSSCKEISNICKPLYKFGITDFSYVKLFNDGRRIDLCNHQTWTVDYLENFFDLQYVDHVINELNLENKKIRIFDEMCGNKLFVDGLEKFNVRNAIGLFKKTPVNEDIFYFYSTHDSHYMLNCYLDNLEFLKKFTFYFREVAKKIIALSYEANLQTPKAYYSLVSSKLKLREKQNSFSFELPVEKYYLDETFNGQYLSAREVECVKWCLLGKTAEETAMILDVSKRTVEAHLEKVKQKLKCNNKQQMIGKVIELGILNVKI